MNRKEITLFLSHTLECTKLNVLESIMQRSEY